MSINFRQKKRPFSKFASLHSQILGKGHCLCYFAVLQDFFIDENTAVLGQTEPLHKPLTFTEEQIINV